jgi:hypothetical protein
LGQGLRLIPQIPEELELVAVGEAETVADGIGEALILLGDADREIIIDGPGN